MSHKAVFSRSSYVRDTPVVAQAPLRDHNRGLSEPPLSESLEEGCGTCTVTLRNVIRHVCCEFRNGPFGNGPTTISEATVSKTEVSEFFWRSPEFRGENSVSSSLSIICVRKRPHRVFFLRSTQRVWRRTP